MTPKLTDLMVTTKGGSQKFLDWVKNSEFRNCVSFSKDKQLDLALRIAKVEELSSRKLLLDILGDAMYMHRMLVNMHNDVALIYNVLEKHSEREEKK